MNREKEIGWWELITRVITWVLGIILIIILFWKIFGQGPSFDDLQNILMITIISLLINLHFKYFKIDKKVAVSFERIKADLRQIEINLNSIKKDLK